MVNGYIMTIISKFYGAYPQLSNFDSSWYDGLKFAYAINGKPLSQWLNQSIKIIHLGTYSIKAFQGGMPWELSRAVPRHWPIDSFIQM